MVNEKQVDIDTAKIGKKRTRLLLDARTELTDDELKVDTNDKLEDVTLLTRYFAFKVARAQYLEFQNEMKRDLLIKKHERDGVRRIEDLMWSVPKESRYWTLKTPDFF